MLKLYNDYLFKLNATKELKKISKLENLLFFFKFIKLHKVVDKKKNFWQQNKIAILNKLKVNFNQWDWNHSKRHLYKPYNNWKFNILKYRRFFLPKYWYTFNYYLLTRYNYLNFSKPVISAYINTHRLITLIGSGNTSNITKNSLNGVVIRNYYRFNFQLVKFLRIYSKKRKASNMRRIKKSIKLLGMSMNFLQNNLVPFLLYKKRKRKQNLKLVTYRSIRYNKPIYINPRKIKIIKKNYYAPFRKFNKNRLITFRKIPKYEKLVTLSVQKNWLTGYMYWIKSGEFDLKINLILLKILFNSYNYKTYNWRITI